MHSGIQHRRSILDESPKHDEQLPMEEEDMKKILSTFIAVCLVLSLFVGNFVYVPSAMAADTYEWVLVSGIFTNLNVCSLAVNPKSPSVIYSGRFGVSKSTNGGRSWNAIGLANFSMIEDLAVDPKNPNVIYAGTEDGVWKTTNGGSGWEQTDLTDSYVSSLAIDPQNTSSIYAGTQNHLYKSTNGGSSWTVMEGPSFVNAIAVDPEDSKTIYIGTWLWSGGGLFKSTDGGSTWSGIGFAKRHVSSLEINPITSSIMYAGIFDGGVYKSTNSGSSWSAINNGLTSLDVESLAVDSGTPQTIYAGTDSGGIFKLQMDSSETIAAPSTDAITRVIQLTIGSRTMRANGSSTILEAAPVILNSRTFLPIRAVVEAAGGTIAWEAAAQKVTIVRKGTTLSLWIGKNPANLNGKSVKIDTNAKVVPIIVSGRTLLPLRFVAEALALDVGWDSKTQVITITYTS